MKPIDMMALRDAGLISSAQDATIAVQLTQWDDGRQVAAMWIGHEWFRFRFRPAVKPVTEIHLPVEQYTLAGRELVRIFEPADRSSRMPVIRWVTAMIASYAHVNLSEVDVCAFPFASPKQGAEGGESVTV